MPTSQKGSFLACSAFGVLVIGFTLFLVTTLLLLPTPAEQRHATLTKKPIPAHTVFRNVGNGFPANLLQDDNTPDFDHLCFVQQGANLTLLQVVRTHKGVQGAYFSGGCRDGGNIFVPTRYFGRLQTLDSLRNKQPNNIPPLAPAS